MRHTLKEKIIRFWKLWIVDTNTPDPDAVEMKWYHHLGCFVAFVLMLAYLFWYYLIAFPGAGFMF